MVLGDRYELIEKNGEGGMALVYKARDRILDRIVAVKVLKEEYSQNTDFVDKFRTEALAAAKMSHPNIVNIYDVGQQGNTYYIVMEYVEGKSLKEIISQKSPLPIAQAVNIAVMICDGVHCAHEKGIIHRDIKPHNILITDSGIVKVADFGIARAINSSTITFGGNIVGSVHYISPEQAKGEPVNRTTDIYSIGCVLYEMVTGQVPFDAESPITVALKHIHDEVPSPRKINPAVPANLEAIILKAMEKVPARRFETAQDLRNAMLNLRGLNLNGYHNRNNNTIVMPPVTPEKDGTKMKKRKLKPTGVALIVIALIGLLSGIFFRIGNNLFGAEVTVPNVQNLSMNAANQKLTKAGLNMHVIARQYDDQVAKDAVISQNPVQGQKVKKGREIKVIISKGPEQQTVPNLVGYSLSEAEVILKNKGLKVGRVSRDYSDRYDVNQVMLQDPDEGSSITQGGKVNVVVSQGAQKTSVVVPNLIGLSLQDAKDKLVANNLSVGNNITSQESTKYAAGRVIQQDTAPGETVAQQTAVNLVVSSGPGPSTTQTKVIQITLPSDQDFYRVVVRVEDDQGKRVVYNQLHAASDNFNVGVTYTGSGTAEVLLNGAQYETYTLPAGG